MPSLQLKTTNPQTAFRFESKQLGAVVTLAPEIIAHFVAHRQQGKIKTEIGGQLFARFAGGEVQIYRATGPNAADKRGWTWFMPDQRKQNTEIKRLFEEGLHFVGDWHTHPENNPTPSAWDFESMNDCFKKSRHQLKAFIMVIVGRAAFPRGLWVSLHDKSKWERLCLSKDKGLTNLDNSRSIANIQDR
jgi:integrative and conjugative element protein (TIGR02256 family)